LTGKKSHGGNGIGHPEHAQIRIEQNILPDLRKSLMIRDEQHHHHNQH